MIFLTLSTIESWNVSWRWNRIPGLEESRSSKAAEEYRLRVGDYRILYVVDDAAQVVEIIAIRHRREAY